MKKRGSSGILGMLAGLALATGSASAQMQTVDPNDAIDADLQAQTGQQTDNAGQTYEDTQAYQDEVSNPPAEIDGAATAGDTSVDTDGTYSSEEAANIPSDPSDPSLQTEDKATFQKDDLIGAAEGVFGKGAEGLAMMIEDILRKQGEPNGYIVGREAGGAFVVGVRYGSGTLYHKVEGERKVYWTGPSIGVDAGANAANSFTLVYNLYDTEDLYKRYGAGEGAAYLIGGFNASYLRRGDVVLIPVRLGVGVRLGANVGYRKFSKKQRWLPF